MDGVDVAIIRAMGTRPAGRRPKPLQTLQPAHIAQVTGLAVNTVKERLSRLDKEGVIAGYTAVPNLRHLGLYAAALYLEFDDERSKEAAVEEARAMDGILELNDFMGHGLCADLAFCDDADRADKIARLRRHTTGELQEFYAWDAPSVPRPLTALDWRIIQALRAHPRAGAPQLAARVGVSSRTVKRRLARMADEGSIFLAPVMDPSKANGLFIFAMLVYLRPGSGPGPMDALRREFADELVYDFIPTSAELGHFDLLLFARTSAEVESMRKRAQAVDGVEHAEAWLFRAFEGVGPWLDDAIDRAAGQV
ncbi:MAG: Lrp/AsnC family transcriptional regulator [Euryarchaeota archaeon]|nr:Lrp/AsnC family transcriptional regulator [Euryarchaeota archaeon]